MTTLLVHAAPREAEALAGRDPDRDDSPTLAVGVGKAAATLALTRALASPNRPAAVLCFGIGGAYPSRHVPGGPPGLQLLETCVVAEEFLVDEGVETPDGWTDLGRLGLADVGPWQSDPDLTHALAKALGCREVVGATVSTISGVDRLSAAYAMRSGALVESMEGAALAMVCREFGVRFAEVRVVSNWTGDRQQSAWDLEGALARLTEVMTRILASGVLP